jgi:5-methyltetrahydropteroyltriglutamate--homocysteine methyltransferase
MEAIEQDLARLRVDQVGSLVIPKALLDAFVAYESGRLNDADLERAQDQAVRETVRKQDAIGFPVLSDGEMRRRNFQDSFANSVSGFETPANVSYALSGVSDRPLARAEQDFSAAGPAIVTRRGATRRLQLTRNQPLEEYVFTAALTKSPVKSTILSPDRIVQRFAYENSTSVYKDREEFLADVVRINRTMIQQLVDAGCKYIQIDAPGYTAYVDDVSIARMKARGEDPATNLAMSIEAENALIRGFKGVVFGIHICRGNARTRDLKTGKIVPQFHREGHYDGLGEQLFDQLEHQRWLLEYDSERAGSFAPLRFLPQDRIAVLGVATTKSSDIETKDFLKSRVDAATAHIPLDRLAISPQCGFGGFGHETISEDEQWRKLERLMEAAKEIWPNDV